MIQYHKIDIQPGSTTVPAQYLRYFSLMKLCDLVILAGNACAPHLSAAVVLYQKGLGIAEFWLCANSIAS